MWLSMLDLVSCIAYVILLCTPHPATGVMIVHDGEEKIAS